MPKISVDSLGIGLSVIMIDRMTLAGEEHMVLEPSARTAELKRDDSNSKIGELVELLTKYGPHISRIAREMGVHKETVRYWYKGLLKKGYTVQAIPNHEKLGLRRVVVLAEFSEVFKPYADAILMAMSELCYLSSFAKTLGPEDLYSIQASVPTEYVDDWIGFLRALKGRGLFNSIQAAPFEWVKVVPMRAEMYDFENDTWQYDWLAKPKGEPGSSNFTPSAGGKFDLVDLNIIKQLQLDPDASLIEVSARLGTNYKTLSWHFRKHLLQNGLLKGYLVNWAGTRYDPRLEKALHRRHKYIWLELLINDVKESEQIELLSGVSRLPFVWLLASGQNFFVQIAFPAETITEALGFVKELVSRLRPRARWNFMDQSNALRFTVMPGLYNPITKRWKFDQAELLSRFDSLVLEIKGMTS